MTFSPQTDSHLNGRRKRGTEEEEALEPISQREGEGGHTGTAIAITSSCQKHFSSLSLTPCLRVLRRENTRHDPPATKIRQSLMCHNLEDGDVIRAITT